MTFIGQVNRDELITHAFGTDPMEEALFSEVSPTDLYDSQGLLMLTPIQSYINKMKGALKPHCLITGPENIRSYSTAQLSLSNHWSNRLRKLCPLPLCQVNREYPIPREFDGSYTGPSGNYGASSALNGTLTELLQLLGSDRVLLHTDDDEASRYLSRMWDDDVVSDTMASRTCAVYEIPVPN
jgi:hypothetical protein